MSVGRELYHLALFPLYFTPLPLHSIIMPNPDHSLQALIEEYERLIASGEPFYMEAESLIDILEYYIKQGKLEEADDCLRIALRLHPDNDDLLLTKAYRLKDRLRWQEAEEIIHQLSEPNEKEVALFYIEKMLCKLDANSAEKIFTETYKIKGDEFGVEFHVDYIELLLDYGLYDRALRRLKALPDGYQDQKHLYELQGEAYCNLRSFDAAIDAINKMIDLDPYDDISWVQLAEVQYKAEKFEEAVDSCDYALTINADNSRATRIKILSLIGLRKSAEASTLVQDFLNSNPDDYLVYLLLAEQMGGLRLYDTSIRLFREAALRCPQDSVDHLRIVTHLSSVLLYAERYEEALETMMSANSANIDVQDVRLQIAEAALAQKQTSVALTIIRRGLEDPTDQDHLLRYTFLLGRNKIYKEAATIWQRLLQQLKTDDPVALQYLDKAKENLAAPTAETQKPD